MKGGTHSAPFAARHVNIVFNTSEQNGLAVEFEFCDPFYQE